MEMEGLHFAPEKKRPLEYDSYSGDRKRGARLLALLNDERIRTLLIDELVGPGGKGRRQRDEDFQSQFV